MLDTNIGFNTHLNNLKTDLVNTINKSGLPVGVAYYIIKDLFMDVQIAYENALKNEKEAYLRNMEEINNLNNNNKETNDQNEHEDLEQKKTKSSCKKNEK